MTDTQKIEDGNKPAFPVMGGQLDPNGGGFFGAAEEHMGLTIRDYFAGQALIGAVATVPGPGFAEWSYYAEVAYHIADAMLAARRTK